MPWPASSSRQSRDVLVSCQTMALARGVPVDRSQTTVVSRWLVIPTATRSRAATPACDRARVTTLSTEARITAGSCSTQPGRG